MTREEFIKQRCEIDKITEASNYYNISIASINMCCRGKTKTSNKLMWQYYEEKEVE